MTGAPSTAADQALVHPETAQAICRGRHGDPFAVLGMHGGFGEPVRVVAFLPQAAAVEAVEKATGRRLARLSPIGREGLFAGECEGLAEPVPYVLSATIDGRDETLEDPYRFPLILGDLDIHLFGAGDHRRLYDVLGAHPREMEGVAGITFAVWAPNASRVSVVGPFNAWDGRRHVMRRRGASGLWEFFLPGAEIGALYKYEILDRDGRPLPLKADPFAFATEMPPATASRIHGLPRHAFADGNWMRERAARNALDAPMSIYEVHLGSWRRAADDAYLTYDALAEELVAYVEDMGFTHVEFLPVSEHPFSGSWGYQPIGLFAPTSRFGDPEGFARLVDACHAAGIGVFLDWVPAHFPADAHGLAQFDGTALYEHADPRQGFHQDWNTLIYNLGRNEVFNFLMSNGLFWLDRYHVDGLRVDAVASMLYLDYSRPADAWVPNVHGGRENLESIRFLQTVNTRVFGDFPGATTAAEESTAWPAVSRPVDTGGLGFGYKWNMGWMHDTLQYMARDPVHRRYHHGEMTFGIDYAFSENFILPLSHDEVVHGKGSLLGKMPGDRWRKFANLRAYYAFMWTHPGKKLLFMGGEFAQAREWNHDHSLDWHLLDDPDHRAVQTLVRDLNRLYRDLPALHRADCAPEGFRWIDGGNADQSVFAFERRAGESDAAPAVVVCNMTPTVREHYRIGVPIPGRWNERLNTDAEHYRGSGVVNPGPLETRDEPFHGRDQSLALTLPPLATLVLTPEG